MVAELSCEVLCLKIQELVLICYFVPFCNRANLDLFNNTT